MVNRIFLLNLKYSLIERILGKYFFKTMKEWSENTKNWNKSDWFDYWYKRLEDLLKKKHNRIRYPELCSDISIDNIFRYPPQKQFPKIFPKLVLSKEGTSGTTGNPKIIPLTFNDTVIGVKTTRGYIEEKCDENILFVSSGIALGEITTSYNRMEIVSRIFRAGGLKTAHIPITHIENMDYSGKIIKKYLNGRIKTISALTGMYPIIFKNLERWIEDEIKIVPSGNILTDSIIKEIKKSANNLGIKISRILNYYIATEVSGAVGWSKGNDPKIIHIDPTAHIPGILPFKIREDDIEISTKVIPLWKAKRGEKGFFAPTLLRDVLILNYIGLKDVIMVDNPNSWPLGIIHYGRWEHRVKVYTSRGVWKGVSGVELRVGGYPVDMRGFYDIASKIVNHDIFVRVINRGFTAEIIVYHAKRDLQISTSDLLERLKSDLGTYFLALLIEKGSVNVRFEYAPDVIYEIYIKQPLMREKEKKSIFWVVENI